MASPPAGEPLVLGEDGKVVAVTANGGVFRIDAGPRRAGGRQRDRGGGRRLPPLPPAAAPRRSPRRRSAGHQQRQGERSDRRVRSQDALAADLLADTCPTNKLACAPAALGRGCWSRARPGRCSCSIRRPAMPLAEPFQPRLEAGAELDWITPVAIGEREAVLVDAKLRKMYRIGLQDEPQPHLAALAEAVATKPVVEPLAVLGETVYLGDADGGLNAFALPALGRGGEQSLGSRCAWGPARVGDALLLSTDDNQLLCLDAKGKRRWKTALEYGPLAGAPLRGGRRLRAWPRGAGSFGAWTPRSGKTLAKVDLRCPLGTGPVALGGQLIVAGHDGTLYEVRQP